MSKRAFQIGLVVALIASIFLFRGFKKPKSPPETAQVLRGNLTETLTLSGQLKADEDATIHFPIGGKLTWVGIKEGDRVRKYQTVATLDQRETKKRLEKYLNTYVKTRHDFDQSRDDNRNTVNDPDPLVRDKIKRILNKYQQDLNNSVLDVEIQNLAIELSRLSSPIDGIVARSDNFYPSTFIASSDSLEIINPQTIYFSAVSDQEESVKINPGDPAQLILDSFPDQKIFGTVSSIGFTPLPNQTSTSYAVKFYFPVQNTGLKYKVGMTGDLSFITKEKQGALFLPNKFVKTDPVNNQKYVYRLNDSRRIRTIVTTGMETDTSTEITSGVSENDTVFLTSR